MHASCPGEFVVWLIPDLAILAFRPYLGMAKILSLTPMQKSLGFLVMEMTLWSTGVDFLLGPERQMLLVMQSRFGTEVRVKAGIQLESVRGLVEDEHFLTGWYLSLVQPDWVPPVQSDYHLVRWPDCDLLVTERLENDWLPIDRFVSKLVHLPD
jgi:hypothetical protein